MGGGSLTPIRWWHGRRAALFAAGLLALVAGTALLAPALAPYHPLKMNPTESLSPPGRAHPMGTDQFGRDILSRAIHGARLSLLTGLVAVAIGATFGVGLGLVAGLRGGWPDGLIMRVVDIMMGFPSVLMALVVVAILGQGSANVMVAVGVSLIPTYIRLVRGNVLSAKEHPYVEAARSLGCPGRRLALRHILPNVVAPIIVLSTVAVAWSIIVGASLSFLGLGQPPPTPEWGVDLSNGRGYLRRGWWISAFPGLCIMSTVIAINLLGDTLRDRLDPRLRHVGSL